MILIYVVAAWVLGIVAAWVVRLEPFVWLALLLIPLGYLLLFRDDPKLRRWHVALVFFVLGALRLALALPADQDLALAQFNEQGRVSLIGVVVAAPEVRQTQTRVLVDTRKIQTDSAWQDTQGLALVAVPRDTPVRYGDEVQVDGAPTTPPDGAEFSYRDYLARENVFTLVQNARLYVVSSGKGDSFWASLYAFREAAEQAINQLLPEPSASLLNGILLGDDSGIPAQLKDDFAATNTAHIIAISGFNIAVLIGVLFLLLQRPARYLYARAATIPDTPSSVVGATLLARHFVTGLILLILLLYSLLVGADASVVRACIMGGLVIVATETGRQNWGINALALAAFVMTLFNPYVLWDVGFQLSFVATLGLLIYAPRMQAGIEASLVGRMDESRARRMLEFVKDGFIVTVAAFLVTTPIIVLNFHRLSLIGFLTNFLILPIQPAIMVLGGAATLMKMLANALDVVPFGGLLPAALAQVLAWGAYAGLQYTILVVQATAAIPFGSFEVNNFGLPAAILFYGALVLVTWLGVRRSLQLLFARVWVPIAVLAVATMLVWTTTLAAPDPRTRVSFIAASEGDATFIRTGGDYRILINGTGEPGVLLSFLGTQLPPWDRRIDLVVTTHLEDDNMSALNAVVERYAVGKILEPYGPARPGISYKKWRGLIEQKQIGVVGAGEGLGARAGELEIEVVGDTTNQVLRLTTEGKTILLAPNLGTEEQRELIAIGAKLDVDVAVLPNEITKGLLERVTPETVILFVGRRPQDKPTTETLKLLEAMTVLRTDERGTITFILDGGKAETVSQK